MGEDLKSLLRIIGNKYGSFLGQGHDGVLELKLGCFGSKNFRGHGHQGSCNDGHDDDGKELLADAVGSFAMKLLDLEHDLFGAIVVLDRPAAEIEIDDLLSREGALV
jgi:hypothetical protein